MLKQTKQILSKCSFRPEIAIILGSGLGGLADKIESVFEISYYEIEDMPVSTAPTHEGKFIFGYLSGKKAVVMKGRIHLYEGYNSKTVSLPIRILRELGAETLIITNAAGGINKNFNCGDIMMINDHISFFVPSPLIGKNNDNIGVRFPDMSSVYNKELQSLLIKTAVQNSIELKKGIYCQLKGPQFETPAEIKALSAIGADAVGMSTVVEAIAAKHCGFKICGLSLIANLACGIIDKPLKEEDINETASVAAERLERLISEFIRNL